MPWGSGKPCFGQPRGWPSLKSNQNFVENFLNSAKNCFFFFLVNRGKQRTGQKRGILAPFHTRSFPSLIFLIFYCIHNDGLFLKIKINDGRFGIVFVESLNQNFRIWEFGWEKITFFSLQSSHIQIKSLIKITYFHITLLFLIIFLHFAFWEGITSEKNWNPVAHIF